MGSPPPTAPKTLDHDETPTPAAGQLCGSGLDGGPREQGGYSRETLICYGTRLLLDILSCSEEIYAPSAQKRPGG